MCCGKVGNIILYELQNIHKFVESTNASSEPVSVPYLFYCYRIESIELLLGIGTWSVTIYPVKSGAEIADIVATVVVMPKSVPEKFGDKSIWFNMNPWNMPEFRLSPKTKRTTAPVFVFSGRKLNAAYVNAGPHVPENKRGRHFV